MKMLRTNQPPPVVRALFAWCETKTHKNAVLAETTARVEMMISKTYCVYFIIFVYSFIPHKLYTHKGFIPRRMPPLSPRPLCIQKQSRHNQIEGNRLPADSACLFFDMCALLQCFQHLL